MPRFSPPAGGGDAPALVDSDGTPAFASGITKAEVLSILNVTDSPLFFTAKITDNTNDSSLQAGAFRKVEYWDIIAKETITLNSETDGSKFTVGSGQAGLYALNVQVGWVSANSTLPSSASSPYQLHIAIYKNNSLHTRQGSATVGNPSAKTAALATEIVLAENDYIEIYTFVRKEDDVSNTGTQQYRGGEYGRWSMRRIGES